MEIDARLAARTSEDKIDYVTERLSTVPDGIIPEELEKWKSQMKLAFANFTFLRFECVSSLR